MKHFPAKTWLALSLTIGLFTFYACQKDGFNPNNQTVDAPVKAGDRSPGHITYGVTVFDGVNPCEIVGIDEGSGAVLTNVPAFYVDNSGNVINLDNLKGICMTDLGQYFITSGAPASTVLGATIYDNSLFKVDPITGQTSYFGSVCPFGSVSDLEFDPNTQTFFGLLNNTNQILEIQQDINGNHTIYTPPAAIFGIQNRVLSGLSLVRDNAGMYLVGAATRPGTVLPGQLYTVPATGGVATWMTNLDPIGDFAGGHCGIGFDMDLNHLAINRRSPSISFIAPGLNEINPWVPPILPAVTSTVVWGGAGFNFEDLTSSVY